MRGCPHCGDPAGAAIYAELDRVERDEMSLELAAMLDECCLGGCPVNPAWPLLHVARPTSPPGPPLRVNLLSAARYRALR